LAGTRRFAALRSQHGRATGGCGIQVIGTRAVAGAWTGFKASPIYPAAAADLRTVTIAGVQLPVRATVAVTVVTFALLFDYSHTFLPEGVKTLGRSADGMLGLAIARFVSFGLVPLAVVLVAFRDQPSRYGLTLGDWRWGSVLVIAGCVAMTPIVLVYAGLPDVRAFYAPSNGPIAQLLVTNVLDLTAAEFAFRGFLMLTLVRVIGPFGVLVAAMPFVFGHLGKPELELFSTLGGGLVYGWLAWRTGSIVWGALGHVYILTLVTVAAGG
jgi:membrane protease YdiL (CAAX protease family)